MFSGLIFFCVVTFLFQLHQPVVLSCSWYVLIDELIVIEVVVLPAYHHHYKSETFMLNKYPDGGLSGASIVGNPCCVRVLFSSVLYVPGAIKL